MDIADLRIDALGQLVLVRGSGERVEGVIPVRCFPFAQPRSHIALCDATGREVESIEQLDDLPQNLRLLVEQELERRELVPRILQIHHISGGAEPTTWEVTTDRGPVSFVLHSEDDVRDLGQAVLVIDDRGLRFLLPSVDELDARSRKLLRRYL
jgi:hypothetical protein